MLSVTDGALLGVDADGVGDVAVEAEADGAMATAEGTVVDEPEDCVDAGGVDVTAVVASGLPLHPANANAPEMVSRSKARGGRPAR